MAYNSLLLPPFLVSASTGSFGLGDGLFGAFSSNFWWHFIPCVTFDNQRVNDFLCFNAKEGAIHAEKKYHHRQAIDAYEIT